MCMVNIYIYFAVSVCGASILAIEILGTRIIGPFYGVDLYLWTSLIGVTLAALSAGYAAGGRLADRGPKLERLCWLIGLSGLWVVVIPWLRHPVLATTESAGLRTAVLVTATILFFPPLVLLGMASPYAIRLKASNLDVVGRTAGNLYAVSTAASVIAAICTGFFLIPNMGVSRLTFLIGIALIITALLGFLAKRRGLAALAAFVAVPIFGAGAFLAAPEQKADPDNGLIAIEHSAYAEIRVVDMDGARFMLIDGSTHTIADPETWESRFAYVDVLDIAKGFFKYPGRLLLIGLGGGSVVKQYARDGWDVDAVEIDPVVVQVANRYFDLKPSEARIFRMDGRHFLIASSDNYDLVILDAFGSSSIPVHLVTKEALELIRSRLVPDGMLALNVEAVGWHDAIVHSLFATLQQVFANVCVLPIAEPPDQLGNLVLLASDRELKLNEEPPVPLSRFSAEYNRAHAWDNRFKVDAGDAPVLTDEKNPVDVWAERINLVARKNLHEYFGSRAIAW